MFYEIFKNQILFEAFAKLKLKFTYKNHTPSVKLNEIPDHPSINDQANTPINNRLLKYLFKQKANFDNVLVH